MMGDGLDKTGSIQKAVQLCTEHCCHLQEKLSHKHVSYELNQLLFHGMQFLLKRTLTKYGYPDMGGWQVFSLFKNEGSLSFKENN